jgi:hypothetical protein
MAMHFRHIKNTGLPQKFGWWRDGGGLRGKSYSFLPISRFISLLLVTSLLYG